MSHFSSPEARADLYALAAAQDYAALERAKTTVPYTWQRVCRVVGVCGQQVQDPALLELHRTFLGVRV